MSQGVSSPTPYTPLRYAFLFLPYLAAEVFAEWAVLSYFLAWLGSFWILWFTVTGKVKPLPGDRPFSGQVMRPVVLTQLMFASFTALTSIFYVLNLMGYVYLDFQAPVGLGESSELALAAQAQRYYVLAHASVAAGMLFTMSYEDSGRYQVVTRFSFATLFLLIAGGSLVAGAGVGLLGGGFSQFRIRFADLAMVASVLSLVFAIWERHGPLIVATGLLYGANLAVAAMSGWKEELLVVMVLPLVFLYPVYRRFVTIVGPIALILFLTFVPAFNQVFRSLHWEGDMDAEEATIEAARQIVSGEVNLAARNWSFFTGRFSEIGMFVDYIDAVPERQPHYGTQIVRQSVESLVPRAVWSDKPITEQLSMERAYETGVIDRRSSVSAKPQYVVDAYLSAGAVGIFLACLLFGMAASLFSRTAERWFGGYWIGTALIYTAFFRLMWKGQAFEFMANTLFWSFVLMGLLFLAGRMAGVIVPAEQVPKPSESPSEATPDRYARSRSR